MYIIYIYMYIISDGINHAINHNYIKWLMVSNLSPIR